MNRRDPMPHDEASELLPWLVNDSLQADEKVALLEHATACVVCRRELAGLEALSDAIGDAAATAEAPPVDMRRINQRIDRHMARRRWLPGLVDAIALRLPGPLKVAVVLQSVVIIGLLALLVVREPGQPAYTTLTTEAGLPPGDYLRVVVSTQLDSEHFEALLERYDLAIVEGPSARGVATVAFADGTDAGRRQAIAAALSGETALRFVQPLNVTASP